MSQEHTNYTNPALLDKNAVMIPTANPTQVYVVDKKVLLGKGKFGSVYEGYLYHLETQTRGKTVAVKEFNLSVISPKTGLSLCTKESVQKEAKNLKKSFETEDAFFMEETGLGYIVTEYIPGEDLGRLVQPNSRTPLVETVCRHLPFEQRVELVWLLMRRLKKLHHTNIPKYLKKEKNNPSDRAPAFVHGDINLKNIRAHIVDNKVVGVELVDRGCSEEIEDSPSAQITPKFGATPFWASPEVNKTQKIGRKTDLRSMVPIILSVLGVEQPFQLSHTHWCEFNIINLYAIRDIPDDIKPFLESFLIRMADEKYDARPDTDECLNFVSELRSHAFGEKRTSLAV